MDSVIERSLMRLSPMYRAFLKFCHTEMRVDILVVHVTNSAIFSKVAVERVRDALREESGGEVRFELSVEEPLPQSDIPLPWERLPRMEKRGKRKAIETVYDGYRFRSRLEARWAVFFHEAKIQYQYEPEGFQGVHGPYLPDFYFPDYKIYAEVKGTDEALAKDAAKIAGAVDYHTTPVADGLLILGETPNYEKINPWNVPMFPYLYHDEGIIMEYATFYPEFNQAIHVVTGNKRIAQQVFNYGLDGTSAPNLPVLVSVKCAWTFDSLNGRYVGRLQECYKAARQARFEHGENGK